MGKSLCVDAQLLAGAGGLRALTLLLLLPSTEPRRPALRPRLWLAPFRRAQPANTEAAGAGGPVPHPLLHVSRWVGMERPAGAQGSERVVALGRAGAWGPPACWAATVVWVNPAQATQENPDPRVPSCVPVMAGQVPPQLSLKTWRLPLPRARPGADLCCPGVSHRDGVWFSLGQCAFTRAPVSWGQA